MGKELDLNDVVTGNRLAESELKDLVAEIHSLQRALHFWMPSIPAQDDGDRCERLMSDSFLLTGYEGPNEDDAEIIGWIALTPNFQAKGRAESASSD